MRNILTSTLLHILVGLTLTLEFSHDAEHIICQFLDEVAREIDELGFRMDVNRKNEILSNIKVYFQLHSVRIAKRRGANIVDVIDVRNALKRVSPSMVVKHALGDPQTFTQAEIQEAKYLNLLKIKLESRGGKALLDAGCGWGRQLIGYRKRGLKAEFLAFDIDKEAVKLGKKLDPSIQFLVADTRWMPFKGNSFDVVIYTAVINFLGRKDTHMTIAEFKRVLKPRGLLYLYGLFTRNRIITCILNIISSILVKVLPEEGSFYFYTLTQIQKLLFKYGFTDIKMEKGFLTIIPCPFGHNEIITATASK